MKLLDRVRLLFARDPIERVAPSADPAAFTGDTLPGPGVPIMFRGSDAENPRLFDYDYNLNSNFQPRSEYNYLASFFHLHSFYQLSPESRVASNYFIESILETPYEVVVRKGTKEYDPAKLERFRALVDMPDPTVGWRFEQWMRAMLQEMIITDAVTVFPLRSKGGEFIAWQLIDGQTIKPIVSDKGGRASPPDVAYIQYIHGVPYAAFTATELIYYPFRPRVWCAYGESRVEEIISVMATLSAHSNYTQQWFGSSNIPESIALLDADAVKNVNEATLASYQLALDEIAGASSGRRRLFQMPPYVKDVKPVKQFEFNKELPEWLVRILCVQFGVPAMLFVSETNRSTAEEISRTLTDKSFRRTLMSTKTFWDELLRAAGGGEFEFVYRQPRDFSEKSVAGIIALATAATPTGEPIMTVAEARKELGIETEQEREPEGGDNDLDRLPPGSTPPALPPSAPGADPGAPAALTASASASAGGMLVVAPAPLEKVGPGRTPADAKAIAHKAIAARSRAAAKMLKEVRPFLKSEQERAVAHAVALARSRGRKVE